MTGFTAFVIWNSNFATSWLRRSLHVVSFWY